MGRGEPSSPVHRLVKKVKGAEGMGESTAAGWGAQETSLLGLVYLSIGFKD
jgi:hypothetical protein